MFPPLAFLCSASALVAGHDLPSPGAVRFARLSSLHRQGRARDDPATVEVHPCPPRTGRGRSPSSPRAPDHAGEATAVTMNFAFRLGLTVTSKLESGRAEGADH